MELATISQVSKMFGVSTRMLRYYEQIGILPSLKKDEYAYRVYDEHSVMRLQQIIVLRKLRVPLKQISMIFEYPDTKTMLQVFMRSLNEVDDEITALSTMRIILNNFIDELRQKSDISLKSVLFSDMAILNAINSLSLTKINFKEARSMEELNQASMALSRLKNVRIVLLPPCTVASYHFIGENPEEKVGGVVDKFVRESRLYEKKPDARMFGFNHPNPSTDTQHYGYEGWVTIPDDMEVPAPLVKKKFSGGMYAAHTIALPDFHEWKMLTEWVESNEKYDSNYSELGSEIMDGCLEEHLNWIYDSHMGRPENGIGGHIDLLLPIKIR